MNYVAFPEDLHPDTPIGGKARALAALTIGELPVPAWFVVLPAAFHASVPPSQAAEGTRDAHVLPILPTDFRLAPEVIRELDAALSALGSSEERFAVRSSAIDEDSARLSFAGQLESFLYVPRAEVALRVASVWRSAFSDRLASYRRSMGANPLAGIPAVIVQRMVDGDASGVAFSADPVSGRRAVAVVAAVRGLASALVSGESEADTWHVDRDDRILKRVIEIKRVRHQRDPSGREGVRAVAVEASEAAQAAITDDTAVRVAALCRNAERHFGRPQDIEWTCSGARLYLLQSRPITTLADRADPDALPALWDNSNIIESYSGVTTPLTFSFARHAYEHVYREFCRLIRMPEQVIEANDAMFCCMLGLIRGRVYYNLYNWYRLVAVLPGYRLNRRFMEQMMGVRESLPERTAEAHAIAEGSRLRETWRLTVSMTAFALHLLTLSRRVARFNRRLETTLGARRPDLTALRPDELAGYYRALERNLLRHWDAPIVNDFATMIFHGLLRRLCAKWIDDPKATLHNDLLCAEPGMVSEEPARRVADMAAIALRDPHLAPILCEGTIPAMRRAVAANEALARAFAEYIERFGDRCMEELKLESSTLHEDATPLYRAVGHYALNLASRDGQSKSHADVTIRENSERRMDTALARHPLRRLVLKSVLGRARTCVRTRENLRFERTRVFGRARQVVLEMGKRLAAVDCLADARDVFYLEIDELLAYIETRATTTDLKGLVEVRKREFERHRQAPVPADRFETRGLAYCGHAFAATQASPAPHGQTLQGLGCCAGIVRGPVRVVRDPRSASIKRGDIVVAERTDPGWVMIFPGAAGLLVERGSLLSHSAIVARELGLPAVISLPGLTGWLKDGDWVEMDGSAGTVVKLEAADGPARMAAA
jgi:pyruvate,water dikinase